MKTTKLLLALLAMLALGSMFGCSKMSAKSADVSDSIRNSLDEAGLKEVSVSQDRDKGIVTLGGQVASDSDKSQAESLAKSFAGAQVVADQIAVIPVGGEKAAKAVNSDLDQGIENNLDAALIQNKMHDSVKYDVKSGVVALTGEVNSEAMRSSAEKVEERHFALVEGLRFLTWARFESFGSARSDPAIFVRSLTAIKIRPSSNSLTYCPVYFSLFWRASALSNPTLIRRMTQTSTIAISRICPTEKVSCHHRTIE